MIVDLPTIKHKPRDTQDPGKPAAGDQVGGLNALLVSGRESLHGDFDLRGDGVPRWTQQLVLVLRRPCAHPSRSLQSRHGTRCRRGLFRNVR